MIQMADGARGPSPELDQDALRERHALEGYRKAMRGAADAIRSQILPELGPLATASRPPWHTPHPVPSPHLQSAAS